jgi:hypothetical protein
MSGAEPDDGLDINGPIAITLAASQNGEFLEIAAGELEGIALDVFGFRVKLAGRLDCGQNQLSASVIDGIYGFGDPSVLPLGSSGGMLSGMLDRDSLTLSGNWNLSIVDGAGAGSSCSGSWAAMYRP